MKILGIQIPFTKASGAAVVTTGNGALTPLGGNTLSSYIGYVRESFAGAWQRNITVDNRQTILASAPVYACVTRIASDISKLRIRLVELEKGTWKEVERASPYWPVLRKPNAYQNRIQFFSMWIVSKLLYGNAFIFKEYDGRGIVTSLHVLHPQRVQPIITTEGIVYYQLGADDLMHVDIEQRTVRASDIIHDRCVTLFHPLMGVSPLYACAMAATQGNRIQSNSAQFFENMSRPSAIMTSPHTIKDETAARLKKFHEENFSGGNIGRLAVFGDGLTYQALTIPAQDAQLIEQLKWTGEDVARAFGVPAYKIGVGPIPTNNNVEALEQQYYSGTLQVLIESIELCLDEGLSLTTAPGDMGTEFDLDGLLRMDSATLAESLAKLITAGIMAPNEGRSRMNLAPVSGGDTPYLQQQNYSLAALNKRDTSEDPFGKAAAAAQSTPDKVPAIEPPVVLPPADKKVFEDYFLSLMSKVSELKSEFKGELLAIHENISKKLFSGEQGLVQETQDFEQMLEAAGKDLALKLDEIDEEELV